MVQTQIQQSAPETPVLPRRTSLAHLKRGETAVIESASLHRDDEEDVRLERWSPGAEVDRDAPGGLELLVLEGSLIEAGEELGRHAWLRLPKGSAFQAKAGPGGVRFWIKTGHLAADPEPPTA